MECSRNITDLPLEILDLLFGYCEDMTNKVNLAKTHPYLTQAFAYHCRNLFEWIFDDNKISLSSWQFILPVCGSNIKKGYKSIRDSSDEELVKLVALHCSKLEKIKLYLESDSVAFVKSLICQKQRSLRAINLLWNLTSSQIYNKMLHEDPGLPFPQDFTVFTIESYYHIQKFENLVKLEIRCLSYTPIDILALCATLKKLQVLALECMKITASEQAEIHLPVIQLKKLSIACDCEFFCPSFQNTEIFYTEERNRHADIQRIILSQGKSLESLSYKCPLAFYGKEDILEVIRMCKNLRFCELPLRDNIFDLEFVEDILVILIQNGVTPDNPLLFGAGRFQGLTRLENWLKWSPRSELLKLVCY